MTDHLLVDLQNGVLGIKLNRPENLNAISSEMIVGLTEEMKKANSDELVKVITITGAGKSFCAGGDINRMGQRSPFGSYNHIGNLNELIKTMRDIEKPIIAAVHGHAAGAGFSLALASDIILGSEDSKYVLSFSKVGLVSDGGGLYFLPKLIGPYLTKELYFRANPLNVHEAHSLGIINHIYSTEEFQSRVKEFSLNLAFGPAKSYALIKKITNQSLNSSLDEILELERYSQATAATTEDHFEGLQAFKEKREPSFKGK